MTGVMPVDGQPGDVLGHHDGGAAQEAVGAGRHPADPQRDQPLQPALVRLVDQLRPDRAGPPAAPSLPARTAEPVAAAPSHPVPVRAGGRPTAQRREGLAVRGRQDDVAGGLRCRGLLRCRAAAVVASGPLRGPGSCCWSTRPGHAVVPRGCCGAGGGRGTRCCHARNSSNCAVGPWRARDALTLARRGEQVPRLCRFDLRSPAGTRSVRPGSGGRAPISAGWVAFGAPTTALRPIVAQLGDHGTAHPGTGPDDRVAHDHAVPDLGAALDPDARTDDRVDHRSGDVGAGGEPDPLEFRAPVHPGRRPDGIEVRIGQSGSSSLIGGRSRSSSSCPFRYACGVPRSRQWPWCSKSATFPPSSIRGQQPFAVVAEITALAAATRSTARAGLSGR